MISLIWVSTDELFVFSVGRFLAFSVVVLFSSAASALEVSAVRGVLDSHPVVASIRKYRGKVVIKDQCKADNYAMFVNYGPNPYLIICPKSAQSLALIERALHHEAVHMAQWCWGTASLYSSQNLRANAIKKGLTYKHADLALKRLGHQPGSDLYESEWEAYYFEDAPPESIVSLLNDNCKDATQKDLDQY